MGWQPCGVLTLVLPSSHTAGMTTTEKIAVSLPRPIAARLRRAVKQGKAASVSAYVASALDEKAKLDDLSDLLDEMLDWVPEEHLRQKIFVDNPEKLFRFDPAKRIVAA